MPCQLQLIVALVTTRKRSLWRLCFLHLSVCPWGGQHAWWWGACMAGGVCMVVAGHAWQVGEHVWQGGMHGSEHVWQGGCVWQGACVAEGHAWQGACMAGGGHAWWRHAWHTHTLTDTVIRSMSGWYTSYWNAFLLEEVNFFEKRNGVGGGWGLNAYSMIWRLIFLAFVPDRFSHCQRWLIVW